MTAEPNPSPRCTVCEGPMPRHSRSPSYCTSACKNKAKQRRTRNRNMLGKYAPPPPPTHCQTCGKVACPTKDAAKVAKRTAEANTGHTNDVRYYQCPDGWWHWTRLDATLDGYLARTAETA